MFKQTKSLLKSIQNPTTFTKAILMVRGTEGLERSISFYQQALGLTILRQTEEWAELSDNTYFRMTIKSVYNESQLCSGYSPFLNFNVMDMDGTISKCVQMGGHLDGPIQYPAHGKTAVLRTPDGHMIGLHEPIDTGVL